MLMSPSPYAGHSAGTENVKYNQTAGDIIKEICKEVGLARACEITRTQLNKTTTMIKPLHEAISFHMAPNTAITVQLSKMALP